MFGAPFFRIGNVCNKEVGEGTVQRGPEAVNGIVGSL